MLICLALRACPLLFLLIFSSLSSSVVPPLFFPFCLLQVLEPDLRPGAQPGQMLCSHQCSNSLLWAMSFSALSKPTPKSLDIICLHCQFFACILQYVALFTLVKTSSALHLRLFERSLPELESKLAMIKNMCRPVQQRRS